MFQPANELGQNNGDLQLWRSLILAPARNLLERRAADTELYMPGSISIIPRRRASLIRELGYIVSEVDRCCSAAGEARAIHGSERSIQEICIVYNGQRDVSEKNIPTRLYQMAPNKKRPRHKQATHIT